MVNSKDGMNCVLCKSLLCANERHPSRTHHLWVNRNSNYHANSPTTNADRPSLRSNKTWSFCWLGCPAGVHAAHIENGVEQPELTKVSRQIRNDTLPIFYGSHIFLFTLFDRDVDATSICKWMSRIGRHNVSLLRKVIIVTRSKKNTKLA